MAQNMIVAPSARWLALNKQIARHEVIMFQPVAPTQKTYEKVIDQILELIREGKLKEGDRLPSERSLCEELGVGRTSLKQAISALCAMGIVESRQGDGNFIVENLAVDLRIPFTAQFFLSDCSISDLVQIRYLIETQIIRIVSQVATKEHQEDLGKIVERMRTLSSHQERVLLNAEFHEYLVNISGNEILVNIYKNIASLIAHQVRFADGIGFCDNHRLLLEAIAKHDAAGAEALMRSHFEDKYPELHENFFNYLR